MVEVSDFVPVALRWFHIAAGITWIGLLYFFNLVNVPAMKLFDGPTKQKITTTLLTRALWWFRWGAAITVFFGLLLMDNMARGHADGWAGFMGEPQGQIIGLGGLLGIIMFLNVWLIIWPNQRKNIEATRATMDTGAAPHPDQAKWARHAYLASRTNFVLSLPMLVMMASSSHFGDLTYALVLGVIATAAGLIWVWYLGQPAKTTAAKPAAATTPPTK